MKIFKTLVLTLLTISIISCSNDDDGGTTDVSVSNLVGTWSMTDLDYNGDSTATTEGVSIETTFLGTGVDIDYSLTFTEDPNEAAASGSYGIELTTTFGGQSVTQVVDSSTIGDAISNTSNETITWSLSGDQLTFNSNAQTGSYTVVELNENNLVLNYTEVINVQQNGTSKTGTIDLTLMFTK